MDVYALGTTLYEMLAGRHPLYAELGDRAALVHKQRHAMPPLLVEVAGLPPRVDAVVAKAIAKDPEARYRTISELARALGRSRSEIYRMVVVLERSGYLWRSDADRFSLTRKLFDLGGVRL
jgi:serine/threonine protein kinase